MIIECWNYTESCREKVYKGECKNCELYLSHEDAESVSLENNKVNV